MLLWIVVGSEFKAWRELSWFMPPALSPGSSVAVGQWTVVYIISCFSVWSVAQHITKVRHDLTEVGSQQINDCHPNSMSLVFLFPFVITSVLIGMWVLCATSVCLWADTLGIACYHCGKMVQVWQLNICSTRDPWPTSEFHSYCAM